MSHNEADEVTAAIFSAAARLARTTGDRIDLANIAAAAGDAGATVLALELARELEASAVEPWDIGSTASIYARLGRTADARRLIDQVPNLHDWRISVFATLGDEAGVERELAAISVETRVAELRGIAGEAITRGELDRAARIVERIPESGYADSRSAILLRLAAAAVRAGNRALAARALEDLEHAALQITAEERGSAQMADEAGSELLTDAAFLHLELGELAAARELADRVLARTKSVRGRKYGLRWHPRLAQLLDRCEDRRRADRIFASMEEVLDGGPDAQGLAAVARMYAEHGRADDARRFIARIPSATAADLHLHEEPLAAAHLALGDVANALCWAARIEDPRRRVDMLIRVGRYCHEHDVPRSVAIGDALAQLHEKRPA